MLKAVRNVGSSTTNEFLRPSSATMRRWPEARCAPTSSRCARIRRLLLPADLWHRGSLRRQGRKILRSEGAVEEEHYGGFFKTDFGTRNSWRVAGGWRNSALSVWESWAARWSTVCLAKGTT